MRRMNLIILAFAILALAVLPVQITQAQTCIPRTDWSGTHIVARGENLYRIALKYNISLTDLATGNCIADVNRVFVGQKLRVPGSVSNPPQYFKLPNRLVKVYEYPSNTSTERASLSNVEIMLIGRPQDANWVYIQSKEMGVTGWVWSYDTDIHADYINPLPVINVGGNQSGISALVPGRYNRLRSGPGFQYSVVTYIHDQTVIVRGRSVDSQWLNIDAYGVSGWIYSDLVQLDRGTIRTLPILGTD